MFFRQKQVVFGKPQIKRKNQATNSSLCGIKFEYTQKDTEFAFSFSAESALKNIQLMLPVKLDLDWKSYVIAPGAIYNGNRFLISPQSYCPFMPTEGVSPNGPVMCVDVPRLTADTGYYTELAANALTIPAVGVYDPQKHIGYILGIEVYGEWGTTGINIKTLPNEPVTLEVCFPVMREKRYCFCNWIDADELGFDIQTGQHISGKILIIPVDVGTIPEFISRLAEYGYEHRGKETKKPTISFAEASKLIENKLDKYNWDETNQYYTESGRFLSNPRGLFMLQTGWTSGGVTFYAMIQSSNSKRRQRAIAMMDTICRNALTPSGYFHGVHTGEKWLSFGLKRIGCRTASLIRRPLECTRDILKTLELLKSRDERIKDVWESAARSNLDAIVDTAERFGHLGYTVDFENGDVLWGDSACGSFGIEALVRGANWFNKTKYLETACKQAKYYVEHFICKGYTCGGVGDSLMAVDSESNYALLSGLVHLYAATKNPEHLKWARQAGDLFSTWVLSYDANLPPNSALGLLGVQPRGAVFANIQNQHGASGICTASGDALLELYKLTGKERYLRLLEDIAQCIPQMTMRPGCEDVWDLPFGSISERLMTMDGMCPCGETSNLSTWAEISMLLTAVELPAFYQDTVRGVTAAFDVCWNKTQN